jgi:glycosyltransferase involved in cell wall biosynthesis
MRLWYIYLGGNDPGSSVQRKAVCQINELRHHGIDAQGIFFTPLVKENMDLSDHVRVIRVPDFVSNRKYFRNYYEAQAAYRFIQDYLNVHESEFDFIFLRHGTTGSEYFKLLKAFGKKIFLYIPSNTIAENFRERQAAPANGFVGSCFRWWEYFRYFYIYEKRLIRSYLSKQSGVVVFTNEFAGILRRQAKGRVNFICNRDGADCEHVNPRSADPDRTGKVKLLFMKGSSMAQPWSGIDRLIESIAAGGKDRFELYITGKVVDESWKKYDFVKLTGRLSAEDLRTLTDQVDLGVSNLANYLIGFNETTNLKSREYFACGLPFIQANSMPDVDGTIAAQYYLNLPNDDSMIDMDLVYEFAMKMRADRHHIQQMRNFAEEHLDWRVTVGELSKMLKEQASA